MWLLLLELLLLPRTLHYGENMPLKEGGGELAPEAFFRPAGLRLQDCMHFKGFLFAL